MRFAIIVTIMSAKRK